MKLSLPLSKLLVINALVFLSVATGYGQTTYVWNQITGGVFSTSTNWTPERATPASSDILVFSDGGTYTVTGVATQTIGKLSVINATKVTLQAGATGQTLTVGDGTDTDLTVAAGCELNISGTNTLVIALPASATASISGNITLSNAAHKLTGTDASSVIVNSGAVITAGTGFSSNAFGTTALNSVVFKAGSTYVSTTGANPFGATAPNSVVIFETGSLYRHSSSNTPSLGNRTYANFEYDRSGSLTSESSTPVTMDNLTIKQGAYNLNLSGGTFIKGNITVADLASLTFNSTRAGVVTLTGPSAQTITTTGTGTIVTALTTTISLNQDIILNGILPINGTIDLKDKTISGTGTLTVNSGATVRTSNAAGLDNTTVSVSSKTFNSAVNYIYNGTTTQMAGELLPTAANSLTVNNPAGLTLMNDLAVTAGVTLTSGNLTLGDNDLSTGAAANIDAAADRYVVINGTGRLAMVLTDGSTRLYGFGTPTAYAGVVAYITTSGNTFTGTVGSTITHPTLHNDRLVLLQWMFEQTGTATNNGTAMFMWDNAAAKGAEFDVTKPVVFASWDATGSKYNLNPVTPTLVGGNVYGITLGLPPTLEPQELIIGNLSAFLNDGPALTADDSQNDVDHDISITFTDDPVWRAAVTSVTINGTALNIADYTLAAGVLTLKPSAGNALLTTSGSKTVAVVSAGYNDVTVTQEILAGAAVPANCEVSFSPALAPGVTTLFSATAKDQYSNKIQGYLFKADLTVTDNDIMTNESYSVNEGNYLATTAGIALPATDANGVSSFNVVLPAVIDGSDGMSLQIRMNDGTTGVGSAASYTAPNVPNIRINAPVALSEATLNNSKVNVIVSNETFADNTILSSNVTLNNGPTGLTVGAVEWKSSTSAEITLSFAGDFDTDVSNFNITVAGAEFALGNPLTSNNLTITAVIETVPVVTTNASITSVGMTTASWGGEVTANGGMPMTQKGVCWSTVSPPTISDAHTEEGNDIGAIVGDMTMLLPGTVYYVRAYGTNGIGTGYGEERTFTTLSPFEDFINYPETTTSYKDGTFVGRDGSTWSYYQCSGNADVDITAPSPVLGKGRTPTAEVRSGQLNNGIGKLSFKYAQSFSSAVSLDVYVNEIKVANVTTLASETMVVKTVPDIDVYYPGNVVLKFIQNSAAAGQVTIDDISWTTYVPETGTVEVPRFSPLSGSFLGAQDITLTSATADAQIYYTTDGSVPTTSSTLYSGPVNLTSTATIKAIAVKSGMITSPVVSSSYTIEEITEVANITALRAGQTGTKVYKLTGEAVLTFQQASRNQKYIQDAGAGILIDDNAGIITTTYNLYDGIKGITGRLSDYGGVLQFVPVLNTAAASSTGNTVTPITVTITELNTNHDTYESRLVKITGVSFSSTGNFAASTNYNVSDGTNTVVFRSAFSSADYIGQAIPTAKLNITGLAMEYNGTAQIASRNTADMYLLSSAKAITSFAFNGLSPAVTATINEGAKTIAATVPAGTNRAALVPTIAISDKASVNPASGVARDFTNPVVYTVTAEDGTTVQYTVTVSLATAIEDPFAGRFTVYPVPARSELFADDAEDVKMIEIFDVTGKKQLTQVSAGETRLRIPVSNLSRGVYFIRFTTEKGQVMKRFVKE